MCDSFNWLKRLSYPQQSFDMVITRFTVFILKSQAIKFDSKQRRRESFDAQCYQDIAEKKVIRRHRYPV